MINITYLSHSGFVLDTGEKILVFDYYEGNLSKYLDKSKHIIFFVSHRHYDHFNKEIFDYDKDYNVTYVLSDDISAANKSDIFFVSPNRKYELDNIKIKTLKSTDEGVAFCIYTKGYSIFYAGDLNLWKWEGETKRYNEQMEADYKKEINKIKGEKFDIAFLVLDPRQDTDFYLGFDYFMKHTDTTMAVPMHMWGKYKFINKLLDLKDSKDYREKILKITKEEQRFLIE